MVDHRYYDDALWREPRERLQDGGRLSHLVFVDGRLVDAWSERVEASAYDGVARVHDEERRPQWCRAHLPSRATSRRWRGWRPWRGAASSSCP